MLGVLMFLFCNCQKSEDADTIQYSIINDSVYTIVDYKVSLLGCTEPIPHDSIATLNLDMDTDGENDLAIIAQHELVYTMDTCDSVKSYLKIKSMAPNVQLCVTGVCLKSLLFTDKINEQIQWGNEGLLYDSFLTCHTLTNHLVGVKMTKKGQAYYGWLSVSFQTSINKIVVHNMAWNHTSSHDFYAGQKE